MPGHSLAAGVLLAAAALTVTVPAPGADAAGQSGATAAITAASPAGAAAAIAFARDQEGKPYRWGGTGPGAFDCSGLVMRAEQAAGISIERVSSDQWATEEHVSPSQVQPGDLVFFAGSDGTDAAPGHVGIVVDPAEDLMIDAYASGFPVTEEPYGQPSSREGLGQGDVVGFTDPAVPS
jgi:cell wall-associated NlpC family hydrolase